MGRVALEYQVSGGGHDAAIPWTRILIAPHFLLMNRIPCEEESLLALQCVLECFPFAGGYFCEIDRHVVADRGAPEILVRFEREAFFLRWNVGEPGLRVECHRLPVVPAARCWPSDKLFAGLVVARRRDLDRTPGFRVDTFRPINRHEIVR